MGRELAGSLDLARTTERIVTAVPGLPRVHRRLALFSVMRAGLCQLESVSADLVALAEAFADQAVVALENARLFAETRAQRNRLLELSAGRRAPARQ